MLCVGQGFLPVRKAEKLCVATDCISATNGLDRTKDVETRLIAVVPDTCVLLLDRWVSAGVFLEAAKDLVERRTGS